MDQIIHVRVIGGSQDELQQVRNELENHFEELPQNGKLVVTDDNYEISELPAIDEYVDEIAKRVVEKMD